MGFEFKDAGERAGLLLGPGQSAESGHEAEIMRGDDQGAWLPLEAGEVADVGGVGGNDGVECECSEVSADLTEALPHFFR